LNSGGICAGEAGWRQPLRRNHTSEPVSVHVGGVVSTPVCTNGEVSSVAPNSGLSVTVGIELRPVLDIRNGET
jgi:hypothetical protein